MNTCQHEVHHPYGEFHGICTLPAGHHGEHDYRDAMGMCLMHEDCRADNSTWAMLFPDPHKPAHHPNCMYAN